MKNVLIICDSRGAQLSNVLTTYLKEAGGDVAWQTRVNLRKGATFEALCNEGINATGWDYLVIAGGICSFTIKITGQDKISQLRYVRDAELRGRAIDQLQEDIDRIRNCFGDKVNIATVPPACLEKYNQNNNPDLWASGGYAKRITEEQAALVEDIEKVNEYIKKSNEDACVETINWRDYVFRNSLKRARTGDRSVRRTSAKFNPKELPDGVHFDKKLQEKVYRRLALVLTREYERLSQKVEVNQNKSVLPQEKNLVKDSELGESSKTRDNLLVEIDNVLDSSQEEIVFLNTSIESSTTSTDEEWDYKRQKRRRPQSVVCQTKKKPTSEK